MSAPCTCGSLAKRAKDPDVPIVEREGRYLLGDGSINDPRLTIHFCPFCGEHGWPGRGNRPCECGVMESLVRDYPRLMEFESEMNEFHILQSNPGGKLQIYYCIACGGNPPESLRHTFFEAPSESDYEAARARMADLKDENDFIREFGAPTHVVDVAPLPPKDIEIYGMKPMKKQWTFEPMGSSISYYLQLMADGTYHKCLTPRHKESKNA
jgi:hypothetical protein